MRQIHACDQGLPPAGYEHERRTAGRRADKKLVERVRAAIRKPTHKQFNSELLSNQQAVTLKKRIEAKLKSGTDVLKAPEEAEPAEAAGNVIDLMQVLKERQPHASSHQAANPELRRRSHAAASAPYFGCASEPESLFTAHYV